MQTYVKQKLGETPEPGSAEARPEEESPATPTVPPDVLAASTVASATEGERWDPNRQLEKLRAAVITRLREQHKRRSRMSETATTAQERTTMASPEDESAAKVSVDDGNIPSYSKIYSFCYSIWFL